jgi:protein-tyrosine phosphatase
LNGQLTELPLGLPGRVYRSPMPFHSRDREGLIFADYQEAGVAVVVVLAERQECLESTGRDLLAFYTAQGLRVIHLPIPDYSVPEAAALRETVEAALVEAQAGRNVAIHCYAGIGRTGLFSACLARRVLGLDGPAAIAWVRQHIPGAVETEKQQRYVEEFVSEVGKVVD